MVDLSKTIIAKSDQLNADDLAGGPMTITITRVQEGPADQPVHFFYDGSGKKSFRPCKSMRRVMADIWGMEATTFVGRSLTVYRDEKVQYGGETVGGVRISHMSHMSAPKSVSLITTRGRRGLYPVKPLKVAVQTKQEATEAATEEESEKKAQNWVADMVGRVHAADDLRALEDITRARGYAGAMERLRDMYPDLAKRLMDAITVRSEDLAGKSDPIDADPFAVPA